MKTRGTAAVTWVCHMYMFGSMVDKKTLRALALFVHNRRKKSMPAWSFYPAWGMRSGEEVVRATKPNGANREAGTCQRQAGGACLRGA